MRRIYDDLYILKEAISELQFAMSPTEYEAAIRIMNLFEKSMLYGTYDDGYSDGKADLADAIEYVANVSLALDGSKLIYDRIIGTLKEALSIIGGEEDAKSEHYTDKTE